MSNNCKSDLNKISAHIFEMGDYMERKHNKKISINYIYEKETLTLKEILEQCFKEEINKQKIMLKGESI